MLINLELQNIGIPTFRIAFQMAFIRKDISRSIQLTKTVLQISFTTSKVVLDI